MLRLWRWLASALVVSIVWTVGMPAFAGETAAVATPADMTALTVAVNDFSIDLHKRLAAKAGDANLFSSPLSASSALAIAYAGARGETAAQMEKVLYFTALGERVHPAFGKLNSSLTARKDVQGYELSIANAIWAQTGWPWLPSYREFTSLYYGSAWREIDFKDATGACRMMNKWAYDNTNGKIERIIDEKALGPGKAASNGADLFITNAVYFKGDWVNPFREDRTKPESFTLPGGARVECRMMDKVDDLSYAEGDGFQAVSLPYKGGNLVMLVLLPADENGLGALEAKLTSELVNGVMRSLRGTQVTLSFPKFKMNQEIDLGGELKSMGMTDAFDVKKGDFTGITEMRPCYVKSVIQDSYVDVNEKGTEAAAVTRVHMNAASAPTKPAVFRADHPFLFFIMEGQSKTMLFVGRVTDPTKEK